MGAGGSEFVSSMNNASAGSAVSSTVAVCAGT
jgi:hypothetical protein